MQVKRTERGWPGHYCCAPNCYFRRNTLLELGDLRIVVSTVGNYRRTLTDIEPSEIGHGRYYETMAFHAKKSGEYWDSDIGRQVKGPLSWSVINPHADQEANDMHESAVTEIQNFMEQGTIDD